MLIYINNVVRPEVDASSLQINLSASDPVSTCTFDLIDIGSVLQILETQEVVVLDNDAFPNQTVNLILNPYLNPYNTSWVPHAATGLTFAQNGGGGITITLSNAAVGFYDVLDQATAVVSAGQTYTVSATVTGVSPVNVQAYIEVRFLDGALNLLTFYDSTNVTPTGTAQRISVSGIAPAGSEYVRMSFQLHVTNATNSGTVTFSLAQLEPQLFAAYGTQYPTPLCATAITNCTFLANGTTVRQQRLFTGFVTHLLFDTFRGPNRVIHVACTSPAFILETSINSQTVTNQTDAQIVTAITTSLTQGRFTTNHVQTGITVDSFSYNNETLRVAMDNIASLSGFMWFIDPYYDVWYVPYGFYATSFGLSDTPDTVTTFPYSAYSRESDFTQPCNYAYVPYGATGTTQPVFQGESIAKYNEQYRRKITNQSITTQPAAFQRGLAEVIQFAFARTILHLSVDHRSAQPILPGYTISVINSVDGLVSAIPYLVQKTTITWLGIDRNQLTRWLYTLELGAYQSELANILLKVANDSTQQASGITESLQPAHIAVVEVFGANESYSHTP